jgi:hypothetical protein
MLFLRGDDMHRVFLLVIGAALLVGGSAAVADESLDAAVGGALGGGLGALVGNELGGRDGAIVGGALGAAAGAAVTTDDDRDYRYAPRYEDRYYQGPPARFCPPGHAKKGWCR